jgi:AcrR family transcriptional regulator
MTTRERLLQVAAEEFAAKGYQEATVAEICRRAEANIAAVNYHFGSKEALYQETWRQAHRALLEAVPPDGGVPATAPAAARLRGRLRAMLQRGLHPDDREFRIMDREMVQPTGLLAQVVQDSIEPLRRATEAIVLELLGGTADEETVRLCDASVIGPCMLVMRGRRLHRHEGAPRPFATEDLDRLTDHFTTFALAGIRAVRRQGAPPARPRRASPTAVNFLAAPSAAGGSSRSGVPVPDPGRKLGARPAIAPRCQAEREANGIGAPPAPVKQGKPSRRRLT